MGPAAIPIMIAMAVMSAAMQFHQSREQAKAQMKSASIQAEQAEKQTNAQYREVDRQQREVNRVAEEQRSDRMRKARQELGTMRVLVGERGAAETTGNAMMNEVGYYAGLDLSRIESNRQDNIEAGQAAKRAAHQGGLNTVEIAKNQINYAHKTVGLALMGAGVQIAGAAASAFGGSAGKAGQINAAKNSYSTQVA
jgi:hypothetical protein